MGPTVNTSFSTAIQETLIAQGVRFSVSEYGGQILVDRTSMVQIFPAPPGTFDAEHASYEACLNLIKSVVLGIDPSAYVMWSGRTDDWLGVDVYTRTVEKES